MPDNDQQKKRAQWDAITRKREEMIAADKEKRAQKKEEEKEVRVREQAEFAVQEQEQKERAVEREEWRQDQHVKREEEAEQRRKKQAEAVVEQKKKEKVEEAQAKRDEQMADLHRKAVERHVRDRIEGAKIEEEKQKRSAVEMRDNELTRFDEESRSKIEHIERDAKRRKDLLNAAHTKLVMQTDEAYKETKKSAAAESAEAMRKAKDEPAKRAIRVEENQKVSRAEVERKRASTVAEEALRQQLFDIDTETKKLIAEVEKEEQLRMNRAKKEANNKTQAAQARRERTEEWFEKGRIENKIKGND